MPNFCSILGRFPGSYVSRMVRVDDVGVASSSSIAASASNNSNSNSKAANNNVDKSKARRSQRDDAPPPLPSSSSSTSLLTPTKSTSLLKATSDVKAVSPNAMATAPTTATTTTPSAAKTSTPEKVEERVEYTHEQMALIQITPASNRKKFSLPCFFFFFFVKIILIFRLRFLGRCVLIHVARHRHADSLCGARTRQSTLVVVGGGHAAKDHREAHRDRSAQCATCASSAAQLSGLFVRDAVVGARSVHATNVLSTVEDALLSHVAAARRVSGVDGERT